MTSTPIPPRRRPAQGVGRLVRPARRRPGPTIAMLGAAVFSASLVATVPSAPAHAAGETVNSWLTTTSDSGGREVARGLQPQPPVNVGPPGGAADQVIAVDEGTAYGVRGGRRLDHGQRRVAAAGQRHREPRKPGRGNARSVRPR